MKEELDQGKYAEITRPSFQLMVILLDDVSPDELPPYLHGKKHILWEKDRPENPDAPHPAYGQIIRQLFKRVEGVRPDEAAQDANRLLDRFLNVLYAYGWQREVVKILGSQRPLIFGELRRDSSHGAIYAWSKYSVMPEQPLTGAMRHLVSATIHADVAAMDWALGCAEVDFQEGVLQDFLATLDRIAESIGIAEMVEAVKKRLGLQRRADMANLYSLTRTEAKSPLRWSADVLGQFFRFGLYDPADGMTEEFESSVKSLLAAVNRDPYSAWKAAPWPYPPG